MAFHCMYVIQNTVTRSKIKLDLHPLLLLRSHKPYKTFSFIMLMAHSVRREEHQITMQINYDDVEYKI